MMNFWKRSGHKDKTNDCSEQMPPSSPVYTNGYAVDGTDKSPTETLLQNVDPSEIDFRSDRPESSRLSKTLHDILDDKHALGYFVQYMELRDAIPFVKFLLDVENFRSFVGSLPETMTLAHDETESLRTPSLFHDSMSVSTDCDSLTADSSSLFDFACERTSPETAKVVTSDREDVSGRNPENGERTVRCAGVSDRRKASIDAAIRIYKKYISHEASYSIRCPEEMRNRIVESLCSVFDSTCFDLASKYVCEVLESEYFEDFVSSEYHCKYQIDVLTSGKVLLSDILYNETALFYFMEFLEQEGSAGRLLEFWLSANNFRQHLKSASVELVASEVQGDAMVLYDRYFSLQATCPLGFDDAVRFEVEQNICDEAGPNPACFDRPVRIVESVLDARYLSPFVASQLFFKYLSELITTVQSRTRTIPSKHRRTGSDCSSEISSVSTHNTLLAMEPAPRRKSKKSVSEGTDMNIDTRQLYDPDSLWRRRKLGLELGRVTELGRFETAIEPQPGKRHESRIGRVMRRFVHLDGDKAKEEMAWQIAEMIVKDVTSLTLDETCPD